jgi:hypothetical protein
LSPDVRAKPLTQPHALFKPKSYAQFRLRNSKNQYTRVGCWTFESDKFASDGIDAWTMVVWRRIKLFADHQINVIARAKNWGGCGVAQCESHTNIFMDYPSADA